MKNLLFFLIGILFLPTLASAAAGPCTPQHCQNIKGQVDATCHGTGTGLVYVPTPNDPNVWCWCKCSCVAGNTLVKVAEGQYSPISELKAGGDVLALGKSGKWETAKIISSDGLGDDSTKIPFAIFVKLENGISLITAPDHVFWMPNQKLIRADRLTTKDKLVLSQSLKSVKVISVAPGDYYGSLWNIVATSETDVSSPYGHLIDTGGVVSGDWAIQRKETQSLTSAPQIGTSEYIKANSNFLKSLESAPETMTLDEERGYSFKPYKPVEIPSDAIYLLPPGEDQAKPMELYPLDYTIPYEMAEYLVNHYKVYYPDVTYQVDWLNDAVNAVAFIRSGRRYIVLYGGLLRHHRIQVEGAGLVTAHELGHHYGGSPKYPNNPWASCEGQSDYWGAKIAQRKVWWGEYAIEQTTKGAEQLRDLFSNGLLTSSGKVEPKGICSHPPAQCRYDTYMAGLRLQPKPACAGDPNLK